MEKVNDVDFKTYIDAKRAEARRIADKEERQKRKSYDPRQDAVKLTEETERYNDELRRKVLPDMKGYMGIWDKETPPTTHGKSSFLYIYANRQAKLQAQVEWIRAEQERHKKTEDEIELFSKKVANV